MSQQQGQRSPSPARSARRPWTALFADVVQDAHYAVRAFRRTPGFAAVAILTLALGIGAATTMTSVVDTILLRPLPFADADRLVRVVENLPGFAPGRPSRYGGVTEPELREWRARTQTLEDPIAFASSVVMVRTDGGAARLWGGMLSANAFTRLGVQPIAGRTFDARDEGNPHVILLGEHAWRQHFNADRRAIGRTIELRSLDPRRPGWPATIIGVLPDSFAFPSGPLEFVRPFGIDPQAAAAPMATMVAFLREGVSLQAAREEAMAIGTAVRPPRPANAAAVPGPRFDVFPLKDQVVRDLRPALRVMLAAVGVLLLIVCANMANLLLARGTARQREIAVRLAIGAGRGRVVRQVMTECLVLAAIGGFVGVLIGAAGVSLVSTLASVEAPGIFRLGFGTSILPRGAELVVDWRVPAIAFAIAAITSVAFGVLPALHLSRVNHLQAMGPRGGGVSRGAARLRAALVVAQLVMATVLLVGAGLLAHSFYKLATVDKGYDAEPVLAAQLVFPMDYSIPRRLETVAALLSRLRALPAVESAGFSRAGLLIGEELTIGTFVPPGQTLAAMSENRADGPRLRSVSDGFLPAMGIPLLSGRDLAEGDTATAPPVVVINRTVARRYFGGRSPVGQTMDWHLGKLVIPVQVVGVAQEVRNESLVHEPFPEIFMDYRQMIAALARAGDNIERQERIAIGFLSFAMRTAGDPAAAAPAVTQIVREVDPNAGIDALVPMQRLVGSSLARERFYAVLLGVFAGVAGLLAAIGIYGVLAYAVLQRTQEIGIRMALGAQRVQVLALVLRAGALLTIAGVAIGLICAAAGAHVLQGMLFGITPLDPLTFAVVALLFALVATAASYVPARRATTVDPMVALRNE